MTKNLFKYTLVLMAAMLVVIPAYTLLTGREQCVVGKRVGDHFYEVTQNYAHAPHQMPRQTPQQKLGEAVANVSNKPGFSGSF